jgi:phthiocerol/phenolphthiocerol synthesis type-I polyketide synthase D
VLAGGVNLLLTPHLSVLESRARMLAPDGRCKAFDAAADGMGRGEGCGLVVLKRLADALTAGDPILAVIRGSAVNHDGRASGLTVPCGLAQVEVIRQALASGGVEPAQVSYVEAHGTGTALGDPIEVEALGTVFGEGRSEPLVIGSVKSNIGYLEGATGIAGLIKAALERGEIPLSLHIRQPSPHIPWEKLPIRVAVERTAWSSRRRFAGISSFTFSLSSTNAHVVAGSGRVGGCRGDCGGSAAAAAPVDLECQDGVALLGRGFVCHWPHHACRRWVCRTVAVHIGICPVDLSRVGIETDQNHVRSH